MWCGDIQKHDIEKRRSDREDGGGELRDPRTDKQREKRGRREKERGDILT